ncbi:redox-regulated molecular chaperone HslO [Lentibacillus halophilus]|uniref:33 kDa chaperonin n=1 Tax=Lentibacillus halophilus TaxID=295065 RepID=A0ABN0Z9K1_9BACI
MKDHLIKSTVYDGMIRAYAIRSTNTVKEAQTRQDTWATASAALGRTVTIGAMMGAMLKDNESLTVKVEGNGPIGAIIADSDATGDVRGYVTNPYVDFDLNDQGKLDVARAVGEGNISVVKDLGLKDYFTGHVPIVSGEIGDDFTYYFANSEQIPSAVGAGVLVNPDHSIQAAGGFIVQVMPGADDDVIAQVEETIANMPTISQLIKEGTSPEGILERLFEVDKVTVHGRLPVRFQCKCSKERLQRAVTGLGKEEIQSMIDEDHGAEATCHFCNEVYRFTEEELQELKESAHS